MIFNILTSTMHLQCLKLKINTDFISKPVFAYALTVLAVMAFAYLVLFTVLFMRSIFSRSGAEENASVINEYNITSSVIQSNNMMKQNNSYLDTTNSGTVSFPVIDIGLSSIIGTRQYQQDAIITTDNEMLSKFHGKKCVAVLCDGMGGMEGGEIASSLCANSFYNDYMSARHIDIPKFFTKEVKKLDDLVCGITNEYNEPLNAGSTMVAVVIEDGKLFWVSVGDSRIYILRNTEMRQVTSDHNYMYILKQQVERGEITMEEALANPKKEALISFLGIGRDNMIDINSKPFYLENGDKILLCSDGLYKTLSDDKIFEIIQLSNLDMPQTAQLLTATAMENRRKSQDNTSVVLIEYKTMN